MNKIVVRFGIILKGPVTAPGIAEQAEVKKVYLGELTIHQDAENAAFFDLENVLSNAEEQCRNLAHWGTVNKSRARKLSEKLAEYGADSHEPFVEVSDRCPSCQHKLQTYKIGRSQFIQCINWRCEDAEVPPDMLALLMRQNKYKPKEPSDKYLERIKQLWRGEEKYRNDPEEDEDEDEQDD